MASSNKHRANGHRYRHHVMVVTSSDDLLFRVHAAAAQAMVAAGLATPDTASRPIWKVVYHRLAPHDAYHFTPKLLRGLRDLLPKPTIFREFVGVHPETGRPLFVFQFRRIRFSDKWAYNPRFQTL